MHFTARILYFLQVFNFAFNFYYIKFIYNYIKFIVDIPSFAVCKTFLDLLKLQSYKQYKTSN